MVIGLLIVSAIPTTIGVCEALSAQKKANAAAKEKAKFHLTATVCLDENGPVECSCILKDGKVSRSTMTSLAAGEGLRTTTTPDANKGETDVDRPPSRAHAGPQVHGVVLYVSFGSAAPGPCEHGIG